MRAEVDCVAVTDHNTGSWVDKLKEQYRTLQTERPEGFRELHLFPGVEVTVNGGGHLLAIFDPSKCGGDVIAFLGAANILPNPPHPSMQCTTLSFVEVARLVTQHAGLAIPAHADRQQGALVAYQGETRKQILESNDIIAAEIEQLDDLPADCQWTAVLGSDSHHPNGGQARKFPGSHFTWVKMGRPSIEGLRLALLDGASLSIQRSIDCVKNPNHHAGLIIKSISISEGRFAGRGTNLNANFSPWMTAIIGGRGAGKSTLIEMMRLCLRRKKEVPQELDSDLQRFAKIPESRSDSGALTQETKISLVIEKDGNIYRLNWGSKADEITSIERQLKNDNWQPEVGKIKYRFPVEIFSQKQILSLAKNHTALLQLIDRSEIVKGSENYSMINELKTRFFRLKSGIRELQLKVNREDEIRGKMEDVNRKIEVFEQGNHHEILVAYRKIKRQESIIHDTQSEITGAIEKITELAENLEPSDIRREDFDRESATESSVLDWIERATYAQSKSAEELRNLAENLKNFTHKWQSSLSKKYCQKRDNIFLEYDQIRQNFLRNGIKNLHEYSSLIQHRQALEIELQSFDKCKLEIQELEQKSSTTLAEIEALRIELSKKRAKFLNTVLQENRYVRISVIPFGDRPEIQEAEFRQALGREGHQLERDILAPDLSTGILAELYQDLPDELSDERTNQLARRVRQVKADILALRSDMSESKRTRWFVKHIQGLSAAQIDGIELWMPRDSLRIEYCRPDGSSWSPIEDGSPGQKSAALLAFLLSYGEEPIILDQPEDDLDNHLIYDLIVQQIRESKKSRQVIVVTHNPNIVVNGDAEAVISMNYRHGQCMIEENGTGCLQEPGPRKEICQIMEGGLKAFKSRYKRLAAGEIDVL